MNKNNTLLHMQTELSNRHRRHKYLSQLLSNRMKPRDSPLRGPISVAVLSQTRETQSSFLNPGSLRRSTQEFLS